MSDTIRLRDEDIETRHHAGSLTAEPRMGDADDTDATDADGTDGDATDTTDGDAADTTDTTDGVDADGTDR